jgi:hypothetical protein
VPRRQDVSGLRIDAECHDRVGILAGRDNEGRRTSQVRAVSEIVIGMESVGFTSWQTAETFD